VRFFSNALGRADKVDTMSRLEGRRLRVVFMGSPEFAVPSLEALQAAHDVVAVVTQPDRPRGRGQHTMPPPVKVAAHELELPVLQPPKMRRRAVRESLAELKPDLFVVAAFGRILSQRMLDTPAIGCFNVHASLLPRYRGAAPIQRAVLDGVRESGVTIMKMDAGLDTGPILLQGRIDLRPDETAGSLHDRLAPLGARLLIEAIDKWQRGEIVPRAQIDAEATMAPMLSKEDGRVDFRREAQVVDCLIRGMDPWPGAFTTFEGAPIKLFHSRVDRASARPGEVVAIDDRGVLVACGSDAVWIETLQPSGRRRMAAKAFAAGHALRPGSTLG
jgi:methionyl-tRNA formyltransferase